jgi:hypothetical protein
MVNDHYEIQQPTSQFFAAQLLTQEWAEPKDAEHRLYLASSDVKDSQAHVLVTAYALQRPDGQWALLLINKDHDQPHQVRVVFHNADGAQDTSFAGPVTIVTFGREQYQWHPDRKKGYADPDGPAVTSKANGEEGTLYTLPAASVTVLRGRLRSKQP